ncbi:MAG: SDR family oxidoreductase [Candidatus Omnitrophica bacterium]|nr:SDR family oxidoreductase [Candidatus Omnitrophota bacterium]
MVRGKKSQTIVLTGGAGFIGSHLSDYFVSEGFRVICVDNFLTGSRENIRHLQKDPRFSLYCHDVSERIRIRGEVHSIFHFASPASPVDYLKYPIKTLKVGSLGTHNSLGLAKAKRARFVLASTSEVYGDPAVHPQKEDYWGHVNPIGPRGVYDEAKRFAEALSLAYYRTHQIDVKIGRIFNTYGPRMRAHDGRVIPNFIDQALKGEPLTVYGKGKQTRSYGYIDDLVRGYVLLWRSKYTGPFNLGNPAEYDILELARVIIELTGSKSKLVYEALPVDDPKRRCPDIRRAKKYLGWSPRVNLRGGLKRTIKDFTSRLQRRSR